MTLPAVSVYDRIRDLITAYGMKTITLQKFRERFIPLLQDSSKSDAQTLAVAVEIEGVYADLIAGELNEDQFISRLFRIAPYVPNQTVITSGFTGTANGVRVENLNLQKASVSADRSYLTNLELTAVA